MIIIMGVPMLKSNLTSVDDQKQGGSDLIFIKVLFMLNTYMCFISDILLARFWKLSSVMLVIFRYCMRLKLLSLE